MKGSAQRGVVYLEDAAGGEPKEVQVTLGLTDGTSVEIRDGLKEGDTVLEFVPGAPGPQEPDGSGATAVGP